MKKIVKLTESDIERIVKRIIVEKLGVPNNISETAEQIFNDILKNIGSSSAITNDDNHTMETHLIGNYNVGDYHFGKITMEIEPHKALNPYSKPIFISCSVGTPSMIKNFNVVKQHNVNEILLILKVALGKNWVMKDIEQAMIDNKDKMISVLSHELHHAYVGNKKPLEPGQSTSEYRAIQSISFGKILPANEFLYYLYYVHAIEDIVRPSELYSHIRTENVTKSQFKEFFKKTEIIDTLKKIRSFKLSTLKSELYNYISDIDDVFNEVSKDPHFPIKIERGNTDDEKVNNFLNLFFHLIIESKLLFYHRFLADALNQFVEMLRGESYLGNDTKTAQKNMNNYVKSLQKYKNYQDFFGNEEKKLNFVADKTIKKLSKLYDMAKDDTTNSILNWDLHHKINKSAEKTLEEIKKLYREGKIKPLSDKKKGKNLDKKK